MSSRRYAPLEAYGLIGDGRSAALVGSDGSVDWWCPPRFDAPSVFARLLDDRTGGFCSAAPAGAAHDSPVWESAQRYRPGTNVLVTTFRGADAALAVTDVMPRDGGPEILRRIEADGGAVQAEVRFAPRFDYARERPAYREREDGYVAAGADGEALHLAGAPSLPMEVDGRRVEVVARFRVEPGRPRWVSLRWGAGEAEPPDPGEARRRLRRAAERDRDRLGELPRFGGHREAVRRSALVLDLLTHEPSGAVVEAATTSLPGAAGATAGSAPAGDGRRLVGGPGATTVLAGLLALGRRREAGRLCRRLAEPRPAGDPRALDHLHGYEGHRPVRAGGRTPPEAGTDSPLSLRSRFEEARDLALGGRPEKARRRFEGVLDRAGPSGLLSGAADPSSGRLRGNVPSAPAHAALVEAASALFRRTSTRSP